MSLSDDDVRYVARLARLKMGNDELPTICQTLNRVLEYVSQLEALDTAAIKPTMHVIPVSAPMRDDRVRASLPPQEALRNGPRVAAQMFFVPQIMDGEGGQPT
ncbi:MAG: Asp-tRNA(Asn)/Glu-tRNA(Gln) amidotransferase subunit GatC [Thermaerobacter sp.]|nr:Asp-tRNA(Asn)/Glu-tRNA(Gln) amidotransferase subunit GatC [Thermaerobacter sp.]